LSNKGSRNIRGQEEQDWSP